MVDPASLYETLRKCTGSVVYGLSIAGLSMSIAGLSMSINGLSLSMSGLALDFRWTLDLRLVL